VAAVNRAQPAPIAVKGSTGVDGELVVNLAGELDMSNVDVVRLEVDNLLDPTPRAIVFDLADLTFMDSSGIAFLVQVAARVEDITLRAVPALIRRVLQATGVTELLIIEP
jgi:anti-anti-sigma factor